MGNGIIGMVVGRRQQHPVPRHQHRHHEQHWSSDRYLHETMMNLGCGYVKPFGNIDLCVQCLRLSALHLRFFAIQRGCNSKQLLRRQGLEPRSGDRCIAWGVSPRIPAQKIIMSRGAATDVRVGGLRLTPQSKICRPSGAFGLFVVLTLGLTPQAKYLSRLRRSVQSSAPLLRFLGRQRESNSKQLLRR